MNIKLEKIVAILALIVLLVVTTVVTININCNVSEVTTPIEENNISIPEVETSIIQEEEEISQEEEVLPLPDQKPLPSLDFEPTAAGYRRINATKNVLYQEIIKLQERLNYSNHIIDAALVYGYTEDMELVQLAKKDAEIYQGHIDYYTEQIAKEDELRFTAAAGEYPIATEVWKYLKGLGYNDYVCAGIMGNLMAEVGGQTLNLHYNLYDDAYEYYGICQWALKYCPEVADMRLEEQLDYLASNIEFNFTHYGFVYATDFTYQDFLNLDNEKEAALAFAKCYERCGSGSYYKRQENATKAYNYFVG